MLGGPEGCSSKYPGNAQKWEPVDLAFPLETGEADDGGDDDSIVSAAGVVVVDPGAKRDGFLSGAGVGLIVESSG